MALAQLVLGCSHPPTFRGSGNGVVEEKRRALLLGGGVCCFSGRGVGGALKGWCRDGLREVSRWARSRAAEAPVVDNVLVRKSVDIPVTCYQILGIPEQAEKDEIVKAVMELKVSEIEDGYTSDVKLNRQDLLMDVRDKLLFESEYAGNVKGKIRPKSCLRIPWEWVPSLLCLLQEAGEEKLVLEMGRTTLQHPDAKPYVHDLLLSMTLAECSIAKTAFEKNKVSEGFEALARAQHLLRSKVSLEKMPLLSQIEESLEELAPSCTLELLSLPHTPDIADRRVGAIAALRELLRQGLDIETSCRVEDWPCFLSQAMSKLMAAEIVELLSWDALAITRKNKKSLQSQNQRVVVDFDSFYMAMIAHIAYGFSTRQTDAIGKAKIICECLIASDGADLKFEEAFCSFLLGQECGTVAAEKLQRLEVSRSTSAVQSIESAVSNKQGKDKDIVNKLLETWLKDAVLVVFSDTRNCFPSLASYFGGPKRALSGGKQKLGTAKNISLINQRSPSYAPLLGTIDTEVSLLANSTRHLGEAVKQLAPANLQNQLGVGISTGSASNPALQLKRNPGQLQAKFWEQWSVKGGVAGRIASVMLVGFVLLTAIKLSCLQFGLYRISNKMNYCHPNLDIPKPAWTMDSNPALRGRNILSRLGNLFMTFGRHLKYDARNLQNPRLADDFSRLPVASATASNLIWKRQMPLEEAEALVKHWQDAKSEALGPDYEIHGLSEILAESMLSKWQDLANSAKERSCFWRFVLLQLSISRADIKSDGVGTEVAEIDAVLEEAAELVDYSQPKNPNYYSTYKIQYVLRRQNDGSWRFCWGSIQNPV